MMAYQLQREQYERATSLSASLSLYSRGVLAGKYAGTVFVDDLERPTSGLIGKGSWFQGVGNAENGRFIQALRTAIGQRAALDQNSNVLFFVEPTAAWQSALATLRADRELVPTPRRIYVARQPLAVPTLPSGFACHPINQSLRGQTVGELPDDVQKVLALRQGSAQPDSVAFGFVIVHQQRCVAWAVVDFMVDTVGEIRLVTESDYRRRGLAAIVCAAAINAGLANGLTQIEWDAAATNIASIRLAEKLGLRFEREGMEYLLIFPEVGYLLNRAWSHLDAGRFELVLAQTEPMIGSEQPILGQYGRFLCAAAWAGRGDLDRAVVVLQQAIAAGFRDVAELENCPPLAPLRETAVWGNLLQQMQTES